MIDRFDWDQMAGSGAIVLAATGAFLLVVIIGGLALMAHAAERPPESAEVLDERLARADITPEQHRRLIEARDRLGPDSTSHV